MNILNLFRRKRIEKKPEPVILRRSYHTPDPPIPVIDYRIDHVSVPMYVATPVIDSTTPFHGFSGGDSGGGGASSSWGASDSSSSCSDSSSSYDSGSSGSSDSGCSSGGGDY